MFFAIPNRLEWVPRPKSGPICDNKGCREDAFFPGSEEKLYFKHYFLINKKLFYRGFNISITSITKKRKSVKRA